jgi:hypothetical protein
MTEPSLDGPAQARDFQGQRAGLATNRYLVLHPLAKPARQIEPIRQDALTSVQDRAVHGARVGPFVAFVDDVRAGKSGAGADDDG